MTHPRSRPWEESLYPWLRDDDELAMGYLNDALHDDDPRVFLLALRQVAEARGIGMTELSKTTGLDRAGLYRTLSKKGNPELKSLTAILKAIGFEINIAQINQAQAS